MEGMRVRFAPSPTGPLHIGGARSALFNFLLARKHGGRVVLRIEDTDRERSSRESEEDIMNSLSWLGIDWDEGPDVGGPSGPYRQMERLDIYRGYVDRLLEQGLAYRCYCSEEELERQRQELTAMGELPRYTGICRSLTEAQCRAKEDTGIRPVIRFHVPEDRRVSINDMVRGEVSFESSGIGDFVIVKSDGIPTYNFAVVVDDHEMGITHVIRAEEHLSNTPRQLMLYEAMEMTPPRFAHISLILGKDRSKMSKRHGATSINQYRQLGYLPEALVNFLALLGWSPEGEEEVLTLEEIIDQFTLDRVAKSPAVFDLEKLRWLNGVYIRQSDVDRIVALAVPYLQEAGYAAPEISTEEYERLRAVVLATRKYLDCLSEIPEHVSLFYDDTIEFEDQKAVDVLLDKDVPRVLAVLKEKLGKAGQLNPEKTKALLKEISKELGLGGKKVFMPIRVALTGKMHGPELHDIIPVLGPEKTAARAEDSLRRVRENEEC